MATAIKEPPTLTDAEWAGRLDGFVHRAQEASIALRKLNREAVDRIVWAMTVAGLENAVELAELAMEETHFGVLADKVLKNYIATEFLYDYLRDRSTRRSPGSSALVDAPSRIGVTGCSPTSTSCWLRSRSRGHWPIGACHARSSKKALPDMAKAAFMDPSIRTNPRIPMIREVVELLEAGYSGGA